MPEVPVKVVHLITLLEFGGAQGNTIYTVTHLDPKNFDTHLWSGKGAYWDTKIEESLPLKNRIKFFPTLVRPLNPLFDFLALLSLWRALKAFKPTILHTHSSKAGIIGRLAGKLAGVPIMVHTFHGFGFNDQQKPWTRGLFVFLEKIIAPLSDALIFVSQSNQTVARNLEIGKENQFHLIRSGILLDQIKSFCQTFSRNEFRSTHGIPVGARVIITIGAFKPQKNLSDFIEVAKIVSASQPDTFFIILGDGELRESLEKKISEHGLNMKFLLPGWREDAISFLAAADIFVLTSLWEGLPRALVEAMALGLPALCYKTDGIQDLLSPEEGTLLPQKDEKGMAAQIIDILQNEGRRTILSNRNKSRIGIEFDINHMVLQQERLYLNLLNNLVKVSSTNRNCM
ncbi:MAG: Glycosyltransferase Gtf1 [Elusimicrobia bacterium]|nr:Glycosyltransferase Gtf1 [Elusimicrobiota bacterium]